VLFIQLAQAAALSQSDLALSMSYGLG